MSLCQRNGFGACGIKIMQGRHRSQTQQLFSAECLGLITGISETCDPKCARLLWPQRALFHVCGSLSTCCQFCGGSGGALTDKAFDPTTLTHIMINAPLKKKISTPPDIFCQSTYPFRLFYLFASIYICLCLTQKHRFTVL